MVKTTEDLLRANCFLQEIAENLVERLETCENRTDTIAHLLRLGYCEDELTQIGYDLEEIEEASRNLEKEQ